MKKKFILTKKNDVKMGFFIENGKVNEIRSYEEDSMIGNIYIGRVTNILSNINAAFVDIQKNVSCYLSLEDYMRDKALKPDDQIVVQVEKDEIKSKQPTLTTKLSLNGNYVVVHIGSTIGVSSRIRNDEKRKALRRSLANALEDVEKEINYKFGGIVRTQALDADDDMIAAEAMSLAKELARVLQAAEYATLYSCIYRMTPAYIKDLNSFSQKGDVDLITDLPDLYEIAEENGIKSLNLYQDEPPLSACYGLDSVLKKALSRRAYLKSGAYLVIEATEAMTVIDVNSGKAVKEKGKEEIIFKLNMEAAEEIARQLRLRNISGIIVVDFISMKSEKQNKKLLERMKELSVMDYVSMQVVDMTPLGLVEITRKKIRKPLYEIMK